MENVKLTSITQSVQRVLNGAARTEVALFEGPPLDATGMGAAALAKLIDHTLLKPDATADDIRQLCEEAREYEFASVCVNSSWLPLCEELLDGTPVKLCTVIGFPLGATTSVSKGWEAENGIACGADEVDMVLNIGRLKSGDYKYVYDDILGVAHVAHAQTVPVKVIIETALLTEAEKVAACLIAKEAGADFVKTSTGFSGGGATVADVALMREVVGTALGVKASGGVRTAQDALAMVNAGATRIGASAGVRIVQELMDGSSPEELLQSEESY